MTTLEIYSSPYLSLNFKLFPYGSDTVAGTGYMTHATNRTGLYTGSFYGISGYHTGHFYQSGSLISVGHFNLVSGSVCRGGIARSVIVDEVPSIATLINGLGGQVGSGEDLVTLTFTDGSNPIADADVWIVNASNVVVAGTLQTNSSGQVQFLLTAGLTYGVYLQKDGYNSIINEQFVAVAD